jgi:NAD(P)-dependent dehydrogenase (short-subunit alcohol dehydrogenase family)
MRLAGTQAVVTGGGTGIGAQVGLELWTQQQRPSLNGLPKRNGQALALTSGELVIASGKAINSRLK